MKRRLALLLLVGLALGFCTSAVAQAHGYGWGCWINRFEHSDRRIPYFALHPPVYYSYPVPRTYGYSPYAYPPTVITPKLKKKPEPMVIPNRFVPTRSDVPESATRPISQPAPIKPLVILNPYVEQDGKIAESPSRR